MSDLDPRRAMDIAELAARRAGEIIRARWSDERHVEEKAAANLVTDIDLACEARVREILARHTPRVPILGEEEGVLTGEDASQAEGLWWYVDPVDGTTNLAHRFPVVAVSVACVRDGAPIGGVVYNPIQEQLFRAALGCGATLNGRRIGVSRTTRLADAMLSTGFPPGYHQDDARSNLGNFAAFSARARAMRRPGSAALDLAAVAAGWFDGFWEGHLSPWDTAAGWLLVTEAGGRVTDDSGGPFDPHRPQIVASNGPIHDAMLEVLSEAARAREEA